MKKAILSIITFLLMGVSNVFAAPINTLDQGQMSIGIVGGNITNCYYLENKVSNNVTIGIQSINSDIDFYGQINFANDVDSGSSPRLIIGSRNLNTGSTTYVGAGITVPLSEGLDGYTSLIAGSELQEFQIGVTSKLSDSVSLNFNYRTVRHNGIKNGLGIGIDCRI